MISAKMIKEVSTKSLSKLIDDALSDVADSIADELETKFESTVDTWNEYVKFDRRVRNANRAVTVEVSTVNQVYALVNNGARNHPIYARTLFGMNYQKNFRPKTRVRVIGSTPGGKFGNRWVRRRMVVPNHPGHKPREFDKVIAESLDVYGDVSTALSSATREYNNAIAKEA